MTAERRKHQRIPLSLEVYCESTLGSSEALLKKLSAGGCFAENR